VLDLEDAHTDYFQEKEFGSPSGQVTYRFDDLTPETAYRIYLNVQAAPSQLHNFYTLDSSTVIDVTTDEATPLPPPPPPAPALWRSPAAWPFRPALPIAYQGFTLSRQTLCGALRPREISGDAESRGRPVTVLSALPDTGGVREHAMAIRRVTRRRLPATAAGPLLLDKPVHIPVVGQVFGHHELLGMSGTKRQRAYAATAPASAVIRWPQIRLIVPPTESQQTPP